MKKTSKILLGVATLWPLVYVMLFFLLVASFFFAASRGPARGGPLPDLFFIIFPLHFLMMLLSMGLTVFYMVDVFRNERVNKDQKVLWAIVLFMGNMIAMPVYWYLYIWPEGKELPAAPSTPGALSHAGPLARPNNTASRGRGEEYVPPPQPPDWR